LQEAELLVLSGVTALVLDVKGSHLSTSVPEGNTSVQTAAGVTTSINRLRHIVDCAHRDGVEIYICLDEQSYSDNDTHQVINLIRQICTTYDIDGILTGNPGLILEIREGNIFTDVLLSPEAMVLNRQAVVFWNEFKVNRIFLPSYLEADEIEMLVDDMDNNDFYVTVFRGCVRDEIPSTKAIDVVFCALCNIPRFHRTGVKAVSVDLGGEPCHWKIGLVTVIKTLLDMIEQGATDEEISRTAREGIECKELCKSGYLCMYQSSSSVQVKEANSRI
jgi:hypothetical protein